MQRSARVARTALAVGAVIAATGLAAASPAIAKTHHGLPVWLVQYMKAHPGGKLVTKPMVATSSNRLGPRNRVNGNCGASYLYINAAPGIGHGWIQEIAGISLDWPITGGGGIISWSNSSTGGHNAYDWAFGFNINGNAHVTRNAYTRVGWIYAVMAASAIMIPPWGPVVCHTPYGQPYSITYAR